jgi:hypothetical protein
MRTIAKIVTEYGQKNYPLGKCIYREEVPYLTSQLKQLLAIVDNKLNFTPESLIILEDKLFAWSKEVNIKSLEDDEIVEIVREVAAYYGEVLALYADGKWESRQTLWGTCIVIEGNVKVTKEGRNRIVPSVAVSLGNIGTVTLELIYQGKRFNLYKDFLRTKKKIFKEEI